MHQWDIRSALEHGAVLVAGSLPSMVVLMSHSFASGSIRWAFWPGPALDQPVRYRLASPEVPDFQQPGLLWHQMYRGGKSLLAAGELVMG